MKDGRSYEYSYTTYDGLLDFTRPFLAKHGFSITNACRIVDGKFFVDVGLLHKTGECLISTLPVPNSGEPRALGSSLSYMKRYGLAGLLCCAFSGDDDDGAAHGRGQKSRQPTPARRQGNRPPPPGAGDDEATVRQKHLWATVGATRKALGLSPAEGEALLRDLMVSLLELDLDTSTKTLTPEQHDLLVAHLKTLADVDGDDSHADQETSPELPQR